MVLVLGLSPRLEGEEMKVPVEGFSGGDRIDLGIPRAQEDLMEAVVASGKPVVLVLLNGSAVTVNWAASTSPRSSKPGIPDRPEAPPSPTSCSATTIPPAACP